MLNAADFMLMWLLLTAVLMPICEFFNGNYLPLFNEAGHLEEEAIASFVDFALDQYEQAEVLEHLVSCDNCLETFITTSEIKVSLTPKLNRVSESP